MITAMHALVFADDPEAARAFFRDVLGFPCVDTGGGWLIFKTGPSELGVHPSSGDDGDGWTTDVRHAVSFACDDIEATVADLRAKGAQLTRDIRDAGWGLTTEVVVPGAGTIEIFEPRYDPPALAKDL